MSNVLIYLVETYFRGRSAHDQAFYELEKANQHCVELMKTATEVFGTRPFKNEKEKHPEYENIWANDEGDSVDITKIKLQK
jgi:hypothetical protein